MTASTHLWSPAIQADRRPGQHGSGSGADLDAVVKSLTEAVMKALAAK